MHGQEQLGCLSFEKYIVNDNNHTHAHKSIVEPVQYGHPGTNQKCPDHQGVLIFEVSLCTKGLLWD